MHNLLDSPHDDPSYNIYGKSRHSVFKAEQLATLGLFLKDPFKVFSLFDHTWYQCHDMASAEPGV